MKQAKRIAVMAAAAVVLGGCVSYAGIEPAAKPVTADSLGATAPDVEWPASTWWQSFGDEALGALIERALTDNPGLRQAQARLAHAQAAVSGAEATLLPQVNASADSIRQRFSKNFIYPPPLAGSTTSLNNLQLGASWEIDFFGKNQAALRAAIGQVRAAQADAQAARVLLATSVARTYFLLARSIEQRDVALATRKQREAIHELVRQRVAAGVDTNVELRQAEGSVPEIVRDIEAFDEQIDLYRHALAALIGQGPAATASLTPQIAVARTTALPAALPADLIGRRADLSAARWRAQAALHDIDSAKAMFYPNVNRTAFAGLSSLGLSRWLESGSQTYGLGPAVRLPIFDAGRLRANLRGKDADFDAAVESYNSVLLDAVRDVADQITSLQSIDRQAAQQRLAQNAAESAFDLSMQRYRAGLGTFITVLTAESNVLLQRRTSTDLKARAIDARIGLIRALGGGYAGESAPLAAVPIEDLHE